MLSEKVVRGKIGAQWSVQNVFEALGENAVRKLFSEENNWSTVNCPECFWSNRKIMLM